MKIAGLYAGLLALLYLVLTFRTITLRGRLRVALGDGGNDALRRAIRAHANFSEYVPIALVMLVVLGAIGSSLVILHGLGLALLVGRILHALGVSRLREPLALRMAGMVLTTGVLLVEAVLLVVSGWTALGA